MASSSGSLIKTKATGDGDIFRPTSRCCLNTNPTDVVKQNVSSRSRLDLVIEDIVSDNGGEGPEKDQMDKLFRKRLNKMYDQPKVSQLELVLHKSITKEEARHILFFPNDDQAGYYRILIANAPKGAPPEHPQRALQIPHLSLLYLHHWKQWNFVSAFVLAGGLHALSSLFTHENFIVRANAINTLVNITAHRDFDWFARYGDGFTTEARLHRAMLRLRSDPAFIPGLIANSWGTPEEKHDRPTGEKQARTFPGGCLICLEVLAMWLSWVRVLHTVDHRLRLSRSLLRAIENWGGNEAPETSNFVKGLPMSPPIQPEGEHADDTAKDMPQNICQNRGHLLSGEITPLEKSVDSLGVSTVNEKEDVKDPQQTGVGITSQPTEVKTSRQTVIPLPRQETTIEAQREERAMVLKLAKTLVEDFGRLPPAEEEWEDLRERGNNEGVTTVDHVERHYSTASATALPRETSSTKIANVTAEELNLEMGQNDACVEERIETVGQEGGRLSCNSCREKIEKNADDSSDGDVDPIRKAEALKTEGSDAFGRGNFEVAQRAYSNALSTLDAAGFPAHFLNGTSSRIEGRSPSEANKLRGVLHRNRAAAMLRLFDRAMVSASTDSYETTTTNPNVGPSEACSVSEGPAANIDRCSISQNHSRLSIGSGGFPGHTSPSSIYAADADSEQRAIALLDQCEEDCLKAIEVNATDKKALFRLAKCREIRKRCRRGGMAAASSGSDTEQERRLQERKAALVSKILARDKNSDSRKETVEGAKGGGTTPSTIKGDTVRCSFSVSSQRSEFRTPVKQDMLEDADSNGSRGILKDGREEIDSASSTPAPIEGGYVTRKIRQDVPTVSSTVIGEGEHISPHAADDNNDMTQGYVTESRMRPKKDTKKKKRNKQHATTRGTAAVELPAIVAGKARSVRPFPASRDRSLLRRVRAFIGRVGVRSKQKQEVLQLKTPTRESEVKELWELLVSLPVECGGLKALLGDEITGESLGCIVRSLSYGCNAEAPVSVNGLKGEGATGRRVRKLFLELSRVKRVDLASAMCSTADKQALKRVSEYVRRFNLLSSSHTHIEDMCVEIEAAVQKLGV